ncbi:hypothetical protein HG531_006164 [Fusarium graminearum]|nr:hypothetical protein HG531_006164 [Fusarium graminearum]
MLHLVSDTGKHDARHTSRLPCLILKSNGLVGLGEMIFQRREVTTTKDKRLARSHGDLLSFEQLTLTHIDLSNHPTRTSTFPDVLPDLLAPPRPLCANTSDITKTNSTSESSQSISQHFTQVRHHGIHHFFLGSQKIASCDDKAEFCLAIMLELAGSRSSVAGSDGDVAQKNVKPRDERHGEIGCVDDMVYVVVFVW